LVAALLEILGDREMKPSAFNYVRAGTVDEALQVLAKEGDSAKIIAGGMSLGPMMNFRLAQPKVLIDIMHIPELARIREDSKGGYVEIGAGIRQAQLLAWPDLKRLLPLYAMALPHTGHYQTRSRGTVCGSIAHSDPSSEQTLCFATIGGSAVLQSKRGTRVVSAGAFQVGMLATCREPEELLVAVRLPVAQKGVGYHFTEVARRRGDFAICAVATIAGPDFIRMGVGGVAERPTVKQWKNLQEAEIDDALNEFAWELEGSDDIHATAEYRRQLVRHLGRRSILEAKQCRL
jgi:2-furoyl-CoA dehydrogenase FAD binding subunit